MKDLIGFFITVSMIVVIMISVTQKLGTEETIENEPVINIHHSGSIFEGK